MKCPMRDFLRHCRFSLSSCPQRYQHCGENNLTRKLLPSKEIRKLFLDYFVREKDHSFVPSSPVFLNNDPTLLFVNAGMNQFRSLLLKKTQPNHPFYNLKRAANSQKCVRLSGKHNDLEDVGRDLHHHTFFEMLGSWSFGDYSKNEACKMSWDLLTNVYGLKAEHMYVTYFGGDPSLQIPPDEECKDLWLQIGVPSDHLLPFGKKDNFWEMGDTGPCGPCTEIHYDFLGSKPCDASPRINAERPDLIELWNLVFIQYNREQDGSLKLLSSLNVDTGMGFERLTAVLQGATSNYDTDIFMPLFAAIEKNFKVHPYQGRVGEQDGDGLDVAYRILADHSRMFCVAIADGLFPDAYDAGHILRKIIRRAAYTANLKMKTRPGMLSSLVPHVAESLDFFPEVGRHVGEIVDIVNEEEKQFHLVVNKGRKIRNKMMSKNSEPILKGQNIWDLRFNFGLEENVIEDLAEEINMTMDWEGYKKLLQEQRSENHGQFQEKKDSLWEMAQLLKGYSIPPTDDSWKYDYSTDENSYGVKGIRSTVLCMLNGKELMPVISAGNHCTLIMDETNFYSEAGGQVSDIGIIHNENFSFKVENVNCSDGFVFHSGTVVDGTIEAGAQVELLVDRDHRLACSRNHTATHLLNSALRQLLHHTTQRSSLVGPASLRHSFSAKAALTLEQIKTFETYVNKMINQKFCVKRVKMSFVELLDNPQAIVLRGEEYPDTVHVVCISSKNDSKLSSVEPCCGTHVHNTADILDFVILPSKSRGGSVRTVNAATGKQALLIRENGRKMEARVLEIRSQVEHALNEMIGVHKFENLEMFLKEVRKTMRECQVMQDAPLTKLEECESILRDLKQKLEDIVASSSSLEQKSLEGDLGQTCGEESSIEPVIFKNLEANNIAPTLDDYKYSWNTTGVPSIAATVCAIIQDNSIVDSVERGFGYQLVTDKTNFYAQGDDQAGDTGIISQERFVFKVSKTFKVQGYVFHEGYVEDGNLRPMQTVQLSVDSENRLGCSRNHTAVHLLNAALRKELPYVCPLSASADSQGLRLTFSSKSSLSEDQLKNIEKDINDIISQNIPVVRSFISPNSLKEFPVYKSSLLKDPNETVPCISIGEKEHHTWASVEPCYGTHVPATLEIGSFVIVSSKSKSKHRILRAVTGTQAEAITKEGLNYDRGMSDLEEYVEACLAKTEMDPLELWDCLKEVKVAKVNHETDLPLLLFRDHQTKLSELTKRLTDSTNSFVQEGFQKIKLEMQSLQEKFRDASFVVQELSTLGDGKKISNFALEHSPPVPVMYFVQDGARDVICSCTVPRACVTPQFSALLWMQPVASLLQARSRTLITDPELSYSVVSCQTDRTRDALEVAKQFALANLENR